MSPRRQCFHFRRGNCHYGAKCKFSHELAPSSSNLRDEQRRPTQKVPQHDALQNQWNNYLRQSSTPRYRQDAPIANNFFQVALQLIDRDVGCFQNTIKQLATDQGLLFIRDLAETCQLGHPGQTWELVWKERLHPLFELVTHPRVLDSAFLEQEVATIYNFLVGVSGSRMKSFFDFAFHAFGRWEKSTNVGSKMVAVELLLCAFSRMIDCNTNNIVIENFTVVASQFESIVLEPFGTSDEFSNRQARRYLDYVKRRLFIGSSLSRSGSVRQTVERANFVLRRDLPGRLSAEGPRHDNDHEDIAEIQILPTENEILSARAEYLPTNDSSQFHIPGIRGRLDREFRLLREDSVGQLRDKIRAQIELMNDKSQCELAPQSNLQTYCYENTTMQGVRFGKVEGVEFVVRFQQPSRHHEPSARRQWWTQSKRLQPGSLVCFISVPNSILFFEVSQSTLRTLKDERVSSQARPKSAGQGEDKLTLAENATYSYVVLKTTDNNQEHIAAYMKQFDPNRRQQRGSLVEFPGVLLASFVYTLEAIQQMSAKPMMSFIDIIAPSGHTGGVVDVEPPQYAIKAGFSFDLSSIMLGGSTLSYSPRNAIDPRQLSQHSALDLSQANALLNTLSRNFSLMQGPPGTGKSWVGEKIIRVLVSNKNRATLGPILCVCYTNHALDQLLEHLWDAGITQIIRIGSRSKSEKLEKLNLRIVSREIQNTKAEKHSLWECETAMEGNQLWIGKLLQDLQYSQSVKSLENHLRESSPRHHDTLFGSEIDDEGFENVRPDARKALQSWLYSGPRTNAPPRPIHIISDADISALSQVEKQSLRQHWSQEILDSILNKFNSEYESYLESRKRRGMVRADIDLRCLQSANVIGVTTTGLARNLKVLSKLRSKVMLCEEAGEVLEAHLLTALLPSVEHAILIGDHLQLRPQIQNYQFQSTNPRGAKYSLDVSLFERLVDPPYASDVRLPFNTLETQRRMHPSISRLIQSTLYPSLKDGDDVKDLPTVLGMKRRLFWLDHEHPEASHSLMDPSNTSHSCEFEIDMTSTLVTHLIRQGSYKNGDIAVITPYLGQLQRLRQRMSNLFEIVVNDRDQAELETLQQHTQASSSSDTFPTHSSSSGKSKVLDTIRIATVDNFQGEEAKVVVISLVRSNKQNRCGFLSTSNRINVLLSRAQHGMYIIGNSRTYEHVPMWSQVLTLLREDGSFGTELELECPRHPHTSILVSEPDHFLQFAPEGGCILPCDRRLACGHVCVNRCHADVIHRAVRCLEPCPRPKKGCIHPCELACGDECLPRCNVSLKNLDLELSCGHTVSTARCWEAQSPSEIECQQVVSKVVPGCKHNIKAPCHLDVEAATYLCTARCNATLPCGHNCKRICHQCRDREGHNVIEEDHGPCKQICGRKYTTCQHSCTHPCHDAWCPPCSAQCSTRCSHSRCSKPCNEPCVPCAEQECASKCPHSRCTMPCAAPCNWVPCSKRCEKTLSCGHQCPSLCGEQCPGARYCQKCCSPEIGSLQVDFIMAMEYREIELNDDPCIFPSCGHVLTRSNMDGLMDLKAHYEMSDDDIPLRLLGSSRPFSMEETKCCPTCRGSLRSIARYGRIVRRAILDEATKKFIAWSTAELSKLGLSLISQQERMDSAPEMVLLVDSNVQQQTRPATSSSRAAQLDVIRKLDNKDRYKSLLSLRQSISAFQARVRREEQPFQRVADFVKFANRRQQTEDDFVFDESVIQLKSYLEATSLLLKCETIIFTDFLRLYDKSTQKPKINLDMSEHFNECEKLILAAQTTVRPRQEAEGQIYRALFCAIARDLGAKAPVQTSESVASPTELLKASGLAALGSARSVIATSPSCAALEPELDSAQKLLNEGVFYSTISANEMRAVYEAMSREFSGTGHWYTCENGHPFTVGECGMPMQAARCPECDAPVGGQNHVPVEGVRRAEEIEELAREVGGLRV